VRVVSIIALCLAGLSALAVCVRMLVLARKSGELPELLIGSGLASLIFLALPLAGLGRLPGLIATPLGKCLFAAGLVFLSVGIGLLGAFTWRVFRPRSLFALCFVGVVTWGSGVAWLGMVLANHGATAAEVFARTRPWAMLYVSLLLADFAWTAFEAGLHRSRLVRRLELGLADPIAINRMSLWLGSGLGLVVLLGAILAAIGQGIPPLRSLPVMTAICLAASAVGTGWGLAFFPPAAYLDWVDPDRRPAHRPASLS
jgi:hypothetical protein